MDHLYVMSVSSLSRSVINLRLHCVSPLPGTIVWVNVQRFLPYRASLFAVQLRTVRFHLLEAFR